MLPQLVRALLCLCFSLLPLASLASPDHCYDFTSPSIPDSCGSLDLTRIGSTLS